MNKYFKRDTSWWINDPFMKCHVGENAFLFIDKTFKEECREDFNKLMLYGYSHYRYLDLLHGGFEYVKMEDYEEFNNNNNVININRKVTPKDIRQIEFQFDEICFYWMQPAKEAVDYINQNYEFENLSLIDKLKNIDADKVVDIKEYKLKRSGTEC